MFAGNPNGFSVIESFRFGSDGPRNPTMVDLVKYFAHAISYSIGFDRVAVAVIRLVQNGGAYYS